MKKISLVVMGLALTTMSFAQHVQLGLKAGVNLAELKDNTTPDTDPRVGYHVGALAHIHLGRTFAIQPEVTYSSQGVKVNTSAGTATTIHNYINIPVLAQYMFANGLRLQTGPQLGILTSAKVETPNNGPEVDIKDQLDNADFAWSFGAGYLLPIGLGIDARYNLGLNNIYKNGTPEAKQRVWQFGLFYQFPARMRGTTSTAR